jgi:hypothetical protein
MFYTNLHISILALLISSFGTLKSQDSFLDSTHFGTHKRSKISYILDDTYVTGGMNRSGIYMSKHFRDLGHQTGFHFGIEQYYPLLGKAFLISGIQYSQRNFVYRPLGNSVFVSNGFIDIPIVAGFELPVFREYDLRLLLGGQVGVRAHSSVRGDYEAITLQMPRAMVYESPHFRRFDMGYQYGLSAEVANFLVRVRIYTGLNNLDRRDQGMLSSFHLDCGYFLFRNQGKL